MTGKPSSIWRFAGRTIDLSSRPCIMAVLNLTPDSFSDGGSYLTVQQGVDAALRMEDEGADMIDIGGESTRPGADPVTADEEKGRVVPVIEALCRRLSIPVSVDTWKSSVASEALAAGAEVVNDISAMTFDPQMLQVVSESQAGVVLMHTRGKPAEMQGNIEYSDIAAEIIANLLERIDTAVAKGITLERIVVDPGIGFGKSVSGNLEILRRLGEFSQLGRPLLVGTSRKSFIGTLLDRPVEERLFGTAATVAYSLLCGASIFRVHDVRAMRDTVDMIKAIMNSG